MAEANNGGTGTGIEGDWYAVQTYSGHENKVKRLLEQRLEAESGPITENREIQEILIPTQEVVEIKDGKRVMVTRRMYPGYVLVKLDLNQRTRHLVDGIQGVIKFVGAPNPQPLREEEMNKILGLEPEKEIEPEAEVPFRAGQVVEVTEGPFTDFNGTVQEVYADKGKVKVEVSLFGRPTSVELDFTQLKGF